MNKVWNKTNPAQPETAHQPAKRKSEVTQNKLRPKKTRPNNNPQSKACRMVFVLLNAKKNGTSATQASGQSENLGKASANKMPDIIDKIS